MPATGYDLDHRTPWSHGGTTTVANLGPLCRHDHIIETRRGWTLRALPDGTHQWTTRLGHTYTTGGKPPPNRSVRQRELFDDFGDAACAYGAATLTDREP